jgi:muconolactone delta-isomerase
LFAPLQVTQADPATIAMKYGLQFATESGTSWRVFGAWTSMNPTLFAANSVNQIRALLASAAMPANPAEAVGTENSVTAPAGVIRATLFP